MAFSGVYAGVNAGYHYGGSQLSFTGTDTGISGLGTVLGVGAIPAFGVKTSDGAIGGGQFGYNYRLGQFLVGAEFDLGYTGSRRRYSIVDTTIPFVPITSNSSHQLDYLGTVRGRLGWVIMDGFVAYGTFGLAFGRSRIGFQELAPDGVPPLAESASATRQLGYAFGGGIEYAIAEQITLKAEFIRYNLGTSQRTLSYQYIENAVPQSSTLLGRFRHEGNIVRIGANYYFN